MRYAMIAALTVVLIALGLALGLAFAPQIGEANCHGFISPFRDPAGPMAPGSPLNPLECRRTFSGGTECSYRY